MSKVYKMTDYVGIYAKAMDVAYFEGSQRSFPSLRSNPRPSAYDKYQENSKGGEGGALVTSNSSNQNNKEYTNTSTTSQAKSYGASAEQAEKMKKVAESLQKLKDTLSATAKALEEKNRQNKMRMEEERRKHNEKVKRDYKLKDPNKPNPRRPK